MRTSVTGHDGREPVSTVKFTSHFGSYNKTYGSLGAAVGFMTWIRISTMVILVGAAELEHQTAVYATIESPKPRGERGARMATVGHSS